jgi:hypothetical protein
LDGAAVNLDQTESETARALGSKQAVAIQTVFDPEVRDTQILCDEYSIEIDGLLESQAADLFRRMARDLDVVGADFDNRADFKNVGGGDPRVGQVIDIDIKDFGHIIESPFNAPVVITAVGPTFFRAATLEWNDKNHPLHGVREFGYQPISGGIRFYTRAMSVERRPTPIDLHAGLEMALWSRWLLAVAVFATSNYSNASAEALEEIPDGIPSIVEEGVWWIYVDSARVRQSRGPTGASLISEILNDDWRQLSQDKQDGSISHMRWLADECFANPRVPEVMTEAVLAQYCTGQYADLNREDELIKSWGCPSMFDRLEQYFTRQEFSEVLDKLVCGAAPR